MGDKPSKEGGPIEKEDEDADPKDAYDEEAEAILNTAFDPKEGSKKATERLISDLGEVTLRGKMRRPYFWCGWRF